MNRLAIDAALDDLLPPMAQRGPQAGNHPRAANRMPVSILCLRDFTSSCISHHSIPGKAQCFDVQANRDMVAIFCSLREGVPDPTWDPCNSAGTAMYGNGNGNGDRTLPCPFDGNNTVASRQPGVHRPTINGEILADSL